MSYFLITRYIDGTRSGASTPDHSGPWSNGMKEHFTVPIAPELGPHNQIEFSVKLRGPLILGRRSKSRFEAIGSFE